ncbi:MULTISPECIES: DUF3370 domain-containing protein [unclassified Thermosynechococcus]|uniref:DUF3370 domain-containing protein n=1 Tax=unclassified Thermosynechococcus TaxID=2622553 RepID=UPI002864E64E|nr:MULTISPECIES: DUF3370 domain-containing protein [unclassified Thermosynechococcus]MDR5638357.1 DUF3370 domain-containing protein [Thermosynechococcus sp. PP42]WNC32977.1 DUF3370 domain-containing protein [Thermosynechococcus sp. PKX95]WNC35503.1 DUF3370 domain-containing protein [Thermosynechococcus sp. PKX91]WNC38023.1 DUF3370 domain-containing protein [Thermosynechococcus sp. WL11]WNC40544.1 DUF3370 domain-containing protein [Thermosynechococcus sp. WL17]
MSVDFRWWLASGAALVVISPVLAQAPATIEKPQKVLPLPGALDQVPVLNSNSPEVVQRSGILLSTFPPEGKATPSAHLNFAFRDRFDIFAHHIAKPLDPQDLTTLYLGILAYNPSSEPVTVNLIHAASYLSQPDAPFRPLPNQQANDLGQVFAGPGDRVMLDILRQRRQSGWPAQIMIPPRSYALIANLPIPVKGLDPPLNGRSLLIRARSSGNLYLASLARFGNEPPTLEQWQQTLTAGELVTPRDRAPTPPDQGGSIIYGRVAGVALGSRWHNPQQQPIPIPAAGTAFSYPISSLVAGRLGTGQVQTAPLVVRYPDTAYAAHGNYGIEYDLVLPLQNTSDRPQTLRLALQTPIKFDAPARGLRFFAEPPNRIFFRGSVRLRFRDDQGTPQSRIIHLVQRQGQQGDDLVRLTLQPQEIRWVQFTLLYPPDATPPQVLTIETLADPLSRP